VSQEQTFQETSVSTFRIEEEEEMCVCTHTQWKAMRWKVWLFLKKKQGKIIFLISQIRGDSSMKLLPCFVDLDEIISNKL
jgi:hypothetical protein